MIGTLVEAVAANRTRLRRARNLRAGTRTHVAAQPRARGPAPLRWLTAGCVLLAVAGAALIVVHARWLAAAGAMPMGDGASRLTAVLPGVAFTVPDSPGVTLHKHGRTALLILAGVRGGPAQRVDLCDQLADRTRPGRLLPLRIGWTFADAAGLVSPRNVLLAERPMPRVRVDGRAGAQLDVHWDGQAQWVGAAARVAPGGEGWLAWRDRA
ncbi:hypothetical protein ACCD08_20215, partial [Telluria sp. Tellsp104]